MREAGAEGGGAGLRNSRVIRRMSSWEKESFSWGEFRGGEEVRKARMLAWALKLDAAGAWRPVCALVCS